MSTWNDFNAAEPPSPAKAPAADRETTRAAVLRQLDAVLSALFPNGKIRRGKFLIGDIVGTAGKSLEIALDGDKAGLWNDHAEELGGDIFDLIAARHGLDARLQFQQVLEIANALLGLATAAPARRKRKSDPVVDELGPHTARWDYLTPEGELIGCVYRYDPPEGKQYRPWDAKRRKPQAPTPRPLYNQPGLAASNETVLVEGEKSADALISLSVCATTAMNGANAPIDKTDWAPLCGKHVLIWPDKDKPGWDYALQAAQAAFAAGAESCALLHPPSDKPKSWDAADAVAEGFDVEGFLRAGERTFLSADSIGDQSTVLDFAGLDWASDDGLALAFTRRYGADWRYCAAWGQWLSWTGMRWNPDRRLVVMYHARGVCRAASHLADRPVQRVSLTSATTVAATERLARYDPAHSSGAETWDADPWLLNTIGGILDLRSGRSNEHDREAYMTKLATAAPRGICPNWERFLHDVTGGNPELIDYLQRVVGYCMTGVTREHALFFLYGTGANGKSVFVNVVATLLGDYATNAPMDTFMEARNERHPTDLAGLRGARFVAAVETEEGRRWNEAKLKTITGGDKITARFMRQDFFEYMPQFKLVIAGNHKPAIRNVDEAMKRRLHLIPFTVTVPPERRDSRLTEKLLAERDGIMGWALRGCMEWQRSGLQPPRIVLDATDEYFEGEDAHGQWMSVAGALDPNAFALTGDLYANWRDWAEENGEYIGSVKRFAAAMAARGLLPRRTPAGHRGFGGFRLLPRKPLGAYRR